MKFSKILIAAASLVAVMGAQAQVTGSLAAGSGPLLDLTSAGLSDGSTTIATLSGGTVYNASSTIAAMPPGTVGNFLAAGPDSGNTATLSFAGGVSYVSFLWGSPDTYNQLEVDTDSSGPLFFDASSVGFTPADGNQGVSQYVQFVADAGVMITGLTFTNNPSVNAFETSNYSITPIPEPETYALMLAGLGVVGFVARRRRAV